MMKKLILISISFLLISPIYSDPDFKIRCILGQVILVNKKSGHLIQLQRAGGLRRPQQPMKCTKKLFDKIMEENEKVQ